MGRSPYDIILEIQLQGVNMNPVLKKQKAKFFDIKIGGGPELSPQHFGGDYFLSPENVAVLLDVSRKFIYELIARGEIKALTVGGRLRRIKRSDLDLWLTSSNGSRRAEAIKKF
jgi:excisionase family DNA binding protein